MQQIFADSLGSIRLAAGVVRIELCNQGRAPEAGQGEPKPVLVATCVLNIPVEGFANMVPHLQGLVEKLEKDGALKRVEAAKQPNPSSFN